MVPMRVMQVPVYEIAGVVSVGHRLVSATRTVHVPRLMSATLVLGCAPVRIGCRYVQGVLIHMVPMHVM